MNMKLEMNSTCHRELGLLFEKRFLSELKKYFPRCRSTANTPFQYLSDIIYTHTPSEYDLIEIKSHKWFPNSKTLDVISTVMNQGIERSRQSGQGQGLFYQFNQAIKANTGGWTAVIIGCYLQESKTLFDLWSNDPEEAWKRYSFYKIMLWNETHVVWNHVGANRFWEEVRDSAEFGDGIHTVLHRSTADVSKDLEQCSHIDEEISLEEFYQYLDLDLSDEELTDCVDDVLNNIPKRLTLENEKIQQDQETENDLPETIEGVSLSKSDFRVIKECFLDGLDFYDTAEKIGKSRSYLQILSKNIDPKYKELKDWMNDLLEQGKRIKEERGLSQDDLINIRQNEVILSLREELAQTKNENASLKAENSLLLATSKNEPQELKVKLVDEHNKQMRNENRELISLASSLTKQIQSMKNEAKSKKALEEDSETQVLKEEIQLLKQQINNLRQENSRQEENLADCLKMGNRYERIIDNLMNQLEGK